MFSLLMNALYGGVHAVAGAISQKAECSMSPLVPIHDDLSSSSSASSLASIDIVEDALFLVTDDVDALNELPKAQTPDLANAPYAPVVAARLLRHCLRIRKLPKHPVQISRQRDYGVDFFHEWIIPSTTTNDVMLVARRNAMPRMKSKLYRISKKRTRAIEVIISGDCRGEFAYIGSFMPTAFWSPFRRDVLEDTSELFDRCAKIPDSHHTDILRKELASPTDDFVFCILNSTGFNRKFCASLIADSSLSAPPKSRKRRTRRVKK